MMASTSGSDAPAPRTSRPTRRTTRRDGEEDVPFTKDGEQVVLVRQLGRHQRGPRVRRQVGKVSSATERRPPGRWGHRRGRRCPRHVDLGHRMSSSSEECGRDLEPHGLAEPAPVELELDGCQQVLGIVLVHAGIGVAGDPEHVVLGDGHGREEAVQVGGDHLLDRDDPTGVGQHHEPRQQRRHLDPGDPLLVGGRVDHPHHQVQAEVGDVRERVPWSTASGVRIGKTARSYTSSRWRRSDSSSRCQSVSRTPAAGQGREHLLGEDPALRPPGSSTRPVMASSWSPGLRPSGTGCAVRRPPGPRDRPPGPGRTRPTLGEYGQELRPARAGAGGRPRGQVEEAVGRSPSHDSSRLAKRSRGVRQVGAAGRDGSVRVRSGSPSVDSGRTAGSGDPMPGFVTAPVGGQRRVDHGRTVRGRLDRSRRTGHLPPIVSPGCAGSRPLPPGPPCRARGALSGSAS